MKKKLLAIVIAIILVLTNAITIYANTTDTVTAASDKTELKAGETFTITLNVSAPSGIAAVTGFSYSYDTAKLEVTETIASTFMNFDENNVRTLMYVGEQTTSTQMATLAFTVKEGVSAGTTTISFGEMIVCSMDNPNVDANTPISLQPITITIADDTCTHSTTEYRHSETQHWKVCSECGQEVESKVAHSFTYADNQNGTTHTVTCTTCGYNTTAAHEFNNGECDKCGATQSTGEEECDHTYETKYNDTHHWNKCSKCNEEVGKVAHNLTYTDNQNGTTHTTTCTGCAYSTTATHEFSNGECENCGAVESTGGEDCTHTIYVYNRSETEHWKVCYECNQEEDGSRATHTFTYTDNKNGTHNKICEVCAYEIIEEHHFNNGTCDECDALESVDEECEHTYEKGTNEHQHWEACSKCGKIKSGTLKTHTFDSYKNNKDGTHTTTCSICGYELKEAHATNVACDKCGYKPTANNNNGGNSNGGTSNGGNNNGTNKDNTIADKEIPKAGLNVMLVFGIVAIVAVALIMYNKNQKYKDIK